MPTSTDPYTRRTARLKADLVEQGRRVERMVGAAVEAIFTGDRDRARWVVEHDSVIDKADVEIEQAAVNLLTDIARVEVHLEPPTMRLVLMIVKVNNELERCADLAGDVAEQTDAITAPLGDRFRVMANSVVGIAHDAVTAFDTLDTAVARAVLTADDTVDAFESLILREMQAGVADGSVSVEHAFAANHVAHLLERLGDHCTNIAEQVIYIATGKIVRHAGGQWSEPEEPPI
ncbi:MAG: hypothetical protein D6693_09830 [Planctomycetota bacterium]|nr:MAG: hypothetical protein D6693_09830 [Planctomycetota bacterium]